VKSIIYAAPRSEIKELQQVRQFLVEKYGKEFALAAIENSDGKVAERVLKKLRVEPPSETLVTLYLKEIARTYGIPWGQTPPSTPPPEGDDDDDPSTAIVVPANENPPLLADPKAAELSKATPPREMRSPINVAPPSPSTENVHPVVRLPDPPAMRPLAKKVTENRKPAAATGGTRSALDDDDLAKRFAALKRL